MAPLENLIKKNPEVLMERDENGATPLHHAAAGGCVALILFIAAAVDPDGRHRPLAEIQHIYILCNLNGDPFVGSSTFGVCLDALGSVLSGLKSSDDQGNVPLHCAVEKNKAESCRALLDLGADPNILNTALLAPLHLAVSLEHNNLVEVRHPGKKHRDVEFIS